MYYDPYTNQWVSTPSTVYPQMQPVQRQQFTPQKTAAGPIWMGCCETVSVRNTSDQPIQVQNANIIIRRPDLQGN